MPGVAVNGSEINESIKSGHVTYKIENYEIVEDGYYEWYDEDGVGHGWVPPRRDWVYAGTGSTGAKITGTVSVPSSKMKISGKNVATSGAITIEKWEASPPIPSSNSSVRYTATSQTSGTGQGEIKSGSSKGKLEGKPIALIGSTVTTCLGTTTTIKTGNDKMKFGS